MAFPIAAAIMGGSSLAGGLIGNWASAREARKNREFQRDMSNTAHQREVADLRAAGLNPILSATGGMGSGASTPSGSTASQSDPLTDAVASAMSVIRTMAEAQKTLAETQTEFKRPENVAAQTASALATKRFTEEQAAHEAQKIELTVAMKQEKQQLTDLLEKQNIGEEIRNKILGQDLQVAISEAKRAKTEGQIDDTTYGKIMRYVDRLKNAVSPWSPNTRPSRSK